MIIYSLILLLTIGQLGTFPVSVKAAEADLQIEQEQEYLDFTLSIRQEMSTNFLMGEVILPYTLDENKKLKADVYFSTDGETFTLLDKDFHEWSKLGEKTKRTCMYPTLSPLKEYLSG